MESNASFALRSWAAERAHPAHREP